MRGSGHGAGDKTADELNPPPSSVTTNPPTEPAVVVDAWVHRIQYGRLSSGEPRTVWMRQDGVGTWLITRDYRMSPEFFLTPLGTWSPLATRDTRHTEETARRLAVDYLLCMADDSLGPSGWPQACV